MQRRIRFSRSSSSQITRKPRSFFLFSIPCRGSLAPPVSSFFTLETTPKVQDKEVGNRKKSKCYTRDYAKVGTFFLVFPSEEKESEREIQTGRSKPKASRYEETRGEEIHPQYHLTSHTTTQQARKNTNKKKKKKKKTKSTKPLAKISKTSTQNSVENFFRNTKLVSFNLSILRANLCSSYNTILTRIRRKFQCRLGGAELVGSARGKKERERKTREIYFLVRGNQK
jgi:hypothetical protein